MSVRQTGHRPTSAGAPSLSSARAAQSAQMVWAQGRAMGSTKLSLHMGQVCEIIGVVPTNAGGHESAPGPVGRRPDWTARAAAGGVASAARSLCGWYGTQAAIMLL